MISLPTELLIKIFARYTVFNRFSGFKRLVKFSNPHLAIRLVCMRFASVPITLEYGTLYFGCGVFELNNSNYTTIPPNARLLFMEGSFDKEITIPDTVTSIITGQGYTKILNLPDSIIYLKIDKAYQLLSNLPNSLIHLGGGGAIDIVSDQNPVDATPIQYPKTLKRLTKASIRLVYRGNFWGIKMQLLESLTHLKLATYPPDVPFPSSLTYLYINRHEHSSINIPSLKHLVIVNAHADLDLTNLVCLKSLRLRSYPWHPINVSFPENLEYLDIHDVYLPPIFPASLKWLELSYINCPQITSDYSSLKTLIVGSNCSIDLSKLPNSIEVLNISNVRDDCGLTLASLPKSLTTLSFGTEFPISLDDLPKSIIRVSMGGNFTTGLNYMCESMRKLVLDAFHQKYPHIELIIEEESLPTLD